MCRLSHSMTKKKLKMKVLSCFTKFFEGVGDAYSTKKWQLVLQPFFCQVISISCFKDLCELCSLDQSIFTACVHHLLLWLTPHWTGEYEAEGVRHPSIWMDIFVAVDNVSGLALWKLISEVIQGDVLIFLFKDNKLFLHVYFHQYCSIVGLFSKSKLFQFIFKTFIHFTHNQRAWLRRYANNISEANCVTL